MEKSSEEWKKELSPDVYRITREGGTEAPFTGKYWNEHSDGMYHCANCDAVLFASDTKFDSGTGWPSFDRPTGNEAVELREDATGGLVRTEAICRRCGAHLGHVFDDGPTETCKRFCINSASLHLKNKE